MRSVIVVDDEPGIVAVLKRLLADDGWTVQTAHDGAEALLLVGRAAPSVLLVDYMMPVMDGAALVKALRRDPAAKAIPVVMMSGLPESMVARKVKGYQAFVRKPFVFEDVEKVLAKVAIKKKR
ncbi:MAG: response regulator [Kofleriaceae bacterium]